MKMTEVIDDVIEVGNDGAFDLDASPPEPPPPPKPPPRAKKPPASEKIDDDGLEDWEIKKQRGNRAFSEGNLDVSINCYTAAIAAISVRVVVCVLSC
jgi:hypothetical protein